MTGVALLQCAWCLKVKDGAGNYTIQVDRKFYTASHGICSSCAAEWLGEDEQQAA